MRRPVILSQMLTSAMFQQLWPHASSDLVNGILNTYLAVFEKAQINSHLRSSHLLAQISTETGGGTTLVEDLTYTHASRIQAVWPSRFPTVESAEPYVNNARALADKVYGGRMGNAADNDDGYNFRGRGLIQITGRSDYESVGKVAGMDLIDNPDQAAAPQTALQVAVGYWTWRNINAAADQDNVEEVTRLVNGGLIGLAQREQWLTKWKAVLNAQG